MELESYNGYSVWGHAILQQEGILEPERYAARSHETTSSLKRPASLAISIPKSRLSMPDLTGPERGSIATGRRTAWRSPSRRDGPPFLRS